MSTFENLQTLNIVIIDDNPSNVSVLEIMLEDEDYENITSFTNPKEGLAYCQNNPVDLILLDILMPEMDGLQVMENLEDKIRTEFLPVIVLTALTNEEAQAHAEKMGAHDYLTKPFQQDVVLERIKNTLTTRVYYKGAMRPLGE
ncbi:MAG: response regulator [Rhodospirillales bacterium]|nr:response regulator [Rhodospirillales bacterium]